MSATLNSRPPCSGTRLSTRSTFAPSAKSRRARLEPMKPSPPVTRTCRFSKWRSSDMGALGPSKEEARELELLRGFVNPRSVAHRDLPDQAHAEPLGVTQKFLTVQHPAHVFGG